MEEPDRYSLEELRDALQWVDRHAHPDRARRLEAELRRRLARPQMDPSATPGQNNLLGPRAARAVSFVTDYLAFMMLWAIIDNVAIISVPHWVMAIAETAMFVGYFALTEGISLRRASPGKKAVGLEVATDRGTRASFRVTVLRAIIVAAFVVTDWYVLLAATPLSFLPVWVLTALWSAQLAVVVYAVLLLFLDPKGRMPHDRITRTIVLPHLSKPEGTDRFARFIRGPRRLILPAACTAVSAIVVFGFHFSVASVTGLDLTASLTSLAEGNRVLEEHIATSLSLRTRVTIRTQYTWSTDEGKSRNLEVKIWIPAVEWSARAREQLVARALERLKVEPGFYDNGVLIVETGAFISVKRTYPLNLPPKKVSGAARSILRQGLCPRDLTIG